MSRADSISSVQSRIRFCCVLSPLLWAVVAWTFFVGSVVLVSRIQRMPTDWLSWGAAGFAFGSIGLAMWVARSRIPRRDKFAAMLDAHMQAGGLVLGCETGGADAWRSRIPLESPIHIRWSDSRALIATGLGVLFLVLAAWIPIPAPAELGDRMDIDTHLDRLDEQIDLLEEVDAIENVEANNLRQELETLRNEQKAEDPESTWEALDHLEATVQHLASTEVHESTEQVNNQQVVERTAELLEEILSGEAEQETIAEAMKAAEELASILASREDMAEMMSQLPADLQAELAEMAQQQEGPQGANGLSAAEQAETMKKLAEAMAQLTEEEREQLMRMMAEGLANNQQQNPSSQGQQGQNPIQDLSPEEIADMLRQMSNRPDGGQCESLAGLSLQMEMSGGGGAGELPGQAGGSNQQNGTPGRGGISRGPGTAPLDFVGETDEQGAHLKARMLPRGEMDLENSSLVGLGASAPDVDALAEGSVGGGIGEGSGTGATVSEQDMLPRHRSAVESYFNRTSESDSSSKRDD